MLVQSLLLKVNRFVQGGVVKTFRWALEPRNKELNQSVDIKRFADGDVFLWIEQESSVHIKTVSEHGDPVELTEDEAEELGKALISMSHILH